MEAIEFDKRVCVCGNTKFYMMPRTISYGQNTKTMIGLHCSYCGEWQKWMSKKDRSRFEALCYKAEKNIN